MRTVSIDKAMNGYIVGVGCQRLVFETRERLLQELGRYLEKPEEVEKEYAERYGLEPGLPGPTPGPSGYITYTSPPSLAFTSDPVGSTTTRG